MRKFCTAADAVSAIALCVALAGGLPAAAQNLSTFAVGTQLSVRPAGPVSVPQGFRPAWDDGRLNPNRGKQLLSGALQSALIWTQTVPRRLVDPRNGTDVTRRYNYLIYPYTDYTRQKRDLAGGRHITVTVDGQQMIITRSRLQ